MSLRLYIDVNVSMKIAQGLRERGVDVLTAQEDGSATMLDPDLMTRAGELGYVLVSHDADMLSEAARRQKAGESFSGVIYARQLNITIGKAIDDLELAAKVYSPLDVKNFVQYLPL